MAVESDADRLAFFDTDDFAVNATIEGVDVPGIFDDAYIDPLGIASTEPMFHCRTSDLAAITPAVARDTAATINGTGYTVQNIEPDGTGMTLLKLNEA